MTMDGWYPDPGGEPGRYRYWDGSHWSETTSGDPRNGPPGAGGVEATDGRVSRLGLIIGILALVVIVVVGIGVFRGSRVRATTNDPLPNISVSGGDDRSPTPLATPSPSATPSTDVPCPLGDPDSRVDHPRDDRVYGGNLSFGSEPTFQTAREEPRFTFAHDIIQQVRVVHEEPGWIAQLAVGQIRAADGFGPKTAPAAETLVECAVTSLLYEPYRARRRDLRSEAITIDGRSGWVIESEVLVKVAGLPFRGDHTIFILVPDGRNWGLFFGAVPIGDDQLDAVLTRAVKSLRIG